MGEIHGQDLPEPGNPFALALPPELGEVPVGFQKRFLHEIGGINLSLQPPANLQAGQQVEIMAIKLQQPSQSTRLSDPSEAQEFLGVWSRADAHGQLSPSNSLAPKRPRSRRRKSRI